MHVCICVNIGRHLCVVTCHVECVVGAQFKNDWEMEDSRLVQDWSINAVIKQVVGMNLRMGR